ncbi:MAG: hypothetical protein MUC68_10410 [Burkholderiaceae bacterium]|jgi:hypothetical protein|nr:hypothetical protein [Burkholderiaceae bacterium]
MTDNTGWRWVRLRQTSDGRRVAKEWAAEAAEPPSFLTPTATVAREVMRGFRPEHTHRAWSHVFGYRYRE